MEKNKDIQSHWNQTQEPKIVRYVDYIGIQCDTGYNDTPYFFLFSDIDTKDPELLRLTVQLYTRYKLLVLWYETKKGWHVVSPSMMTISAWDRARRDLAEFLDNYYRNLVLRIERKSGDSFVLNHHNSDVEQLHNISDSLLSLYEKKFSCSIPAPNRVKTQLLFSHYTQVVIDDV